MRLFALIFACLLATLCAGSLQAQTAATTPAPLGPGVPAFTVRPGYRVTLAAQGLEEARFLEMDDQGGLFVCQPRHGTIMLLREPDALGLYKTRTTFLSGQKLAHGLHYFRGWLWIGRPDAVIKARDTNGDGAADEVVTVLDKLPGEGGHYFRSMLVTDQGFYTSVGDSGNITDQTATDRQKIWRYNLDGTGKALFASGLRNTEKLRPRPGTSEIWGADHGSDNFGGPLGEQAGRSQPITDLNPPDELNHYTQGGFYGHPFIVGLRIPRYEHAQRKDIVDLAARTIPPAWAFGAHWAVNGFTFLSLENRHFPANHRGDLFAASHGSWNSITRVGYRIQRVLFDSVSGLPYGSLPIVSTLAADGKTVLDRPVDCLEAPDGSILFSCDQTNNVYRLQWVGP